METAHISCSTSVGEDGDFPVRCSEDVLLPLFTDKSVMDNPIPSLQLAAPPCAPPALPELRLVLLGRKEAGKSAAGNAILGAAGGFQSGKPTDECVKIRADVAGRKLTVVDTPGWEWYYPLNSTANWVRRETLRSVTLCRPGPHAVLLVVRSCASITDEYVHEMEEHLELLGKGVWDYTMLLFTRGDELGLASMEQRISTSGPALHRLLRRCGSRYHVMNNHSRGDPTQVKELMEKLQAMAGRGCFLLMDNVVLTEADEKRRARERRKKQRQTEEQMQRATIKAALMNDDLQDSELDGHQSFSQVPRRFLEVRLVLLGERETGKSSAGNAILGGAGSFQAGAATEECVRRQAEVAKRLVTVVDTPGWEAGFSGGTTERVKREIATSVGLCPPGPHGLLLTLRVDTLVVSGHVRDHLQLLSEGAWRHTLLLFTHGDQLREGVTIQQHIQGGGRDLQWLLEKCRGRYHVISSLQGGEPGQAGVTELLQKVEKMAVMNRCEAFSGLVHEIRVLSQQKMEKFNQRMKEMGEKMLRQKAELQKMREREMKSIRWIFERKKKVKFHEKTGLEREEEEDGGSRSGGRKTDDGELEERIRWLAEDKEREIQDLSVERERIHAALSQSLTEREEATFRLELKQRELEELNERTEELQVKVLHLECASVEKENERKHREESDEAMRQKWMAQVQKLVKDIELQKKEKAEWMEKVGSLQTEMQESEMQQKSVVRRKTHEKNTAMAEMERRLKGEMEAKLFEKDQQQEELRREMQAIVENVKLCERQTEIKVEEMKSQHEKEVENQEAEVELLKLQHREEMDRKTSEMREIQEELKGQHRKEEKENARIHIKFRKEKTILIQEKEKEIKVLNQQHQQEMEGRLKERERREEQIKEMEKAVEELRQEYEDKIKGVEKNSQREMKELSQKSEREIEKLFQERQRMEKYVLELEERVTENEKTKEAMIENHRQSILLHLKERDAHVDELKREHVSEIQDKIQEFEREKDRIVTTLQEEAEKREKAKETELTGLKLGLTEMKQKLQQMEERSGEMEATNARLIDLEHQLRWRAEERETDERRVQEKRREKEQRIDALNQRITDMNEMLQRKEEEEDENRKEVEKRLQGRERELEEVTRQLLKERESLPQQDECGWRDEQRRQENEMNLAKELIAQKAREITEAQQLLAKREREMEEAKRECASHLKEMKEMEESCKSQTVALLRIQQSHAEQLRRKDAEMVEKVQESEEEMDRLRRESGEKEKEMALLRWRMEQTRNELKDVSRKMEKEMTGMIQQYEREIERKNHLVASVAKEKDRALEKYDDSRRRIEELQEENEKMRKEAESVRMELKTEVEEEVIRQQVESGEADVKEGDAQMRRLKDRQEGEVDNIRTEKKREGGRKPQVIKKDLRSEKQPQFAQKEPQRKEEIQKREKEVAERKKALGRNEEALSKRGYELGRKEEEPGDRETGPENKEVCRLGKGRENEEGQKEQRGSEGDEERRRQREPGEATPRRPAGTEGEMNALKEELHRKERNERVQEDLHLHLELDDQWEGSVSDGGEEREGKEEGKGGTTSPGQAEVLRAPPAGHPNGPALRVMLLGESWSPRAPDGLSILCGETSEGGGSTFRHWRGQVGGRRLSLVEPSGLKWRDGPGPNRAGQRRSILDSVWQCGPGPHVVLLLLPAFLTCTPRLRSAVEEQVSWLGPDAWRRALLLFTWAEAMGESVEQHLLRNRELMELVGKCEGRYHTVTSGNNHWLVEGLLEKMDNIAAMNRF